MIRTLCNYLMLLSLIAVTGCRVAPAESQDCIYSLAGLEVFSDSIVHDGREYTALSDYEITGAWKTDSLTAARLPLALSSSSGMADALFIKAMTELNASGNYSDLDTWLALVIINPGQARDVLRHMASDIQPDTTSENPAIMRGGLWTTAAWELYCVTGDREWLEEAWNLVSKVLPSGMYKGDLISGIPEHLTPTGDYFPSWMLTVDLLQVKTLGVNVMHQMALTAAAAMADELGYKDGERLRQQAATLKNNINDTFWDPSLSRYGQYLYGGMFPILSSGADNTAGFLTALSGIATDEMTRALLSATPTLPGGVPPTFPSASATPPLSPRLQALHGIVATMIPDQLSIRQSVAALWTLLLDEPSGTAWPALLIRGLFGISFHHDGMHLSPVIPAIFDGPITLSGLTYRDATLDITIQGSGDRIASVTIDDITVADPIVPPSLTGKHEVKITLAGNTLHGQGATLVTDISLPPMPKVYWKDREATILNHSADTDYQVYVNGVVSEVLDDPHYTLSGGGTQVIDFVPVTTVDGLQRAGFSPRSHVNTQDGDLISIPASSITPRRAPLRLIKDYETATKYIELAARHNTRLTFYVNAPSGGDYFLRINYSNGTTETAWRSVEVNSVTVGSLACPPGRRADWITTHPSTILTVPLREGPNKLSLYYINGTILLNEIRLLKR